MRSRISILLALAVFVGSFALVTVVQSSSASAALPYSSDTPLPSASLGPDNCVKARTKALTKVKSTSKPIRYSCVQDAPTSSGFPQSKRTAAPNGSSPLPFYFCALAATTYTPMTKEERFNQCVIGRKLVLAYDVDGDGALVEIGRAYLDVTQWVTSHPHNQSVTLNTSIYAEPPTGDPITGIKQLGVYAAGVPWTSTAYCNQIDSSPSVTCLTGDYEPQTKLIAIGDSQKDLWQFDATTDQPITKRALYTGNDFTLPGFLPTALPLEFRTQGYLRCDNVGTSNPVDHYIGGAPGCVLITSRLPTLTISQNRKLPDGSENTMSDSAQFVYKAQLQLPGHPGSHYNSSFAGAPLHRRYPVQARDCGGFDSETPNLSSNSPFFDSCDEYPFASSAEGGVGKAAVAHVDLGSNKAVGIELGSKFYQTWRILNNEAYYVNVAGGVANPTPVLSDLDEETGFFKCGGTVGQKTPYQIDWTTKQTVAVNIHPYQSYVAGNTYEYNLCVEDYNRPGTTINFAVLQSDGNFVVYTGGHSWYNPGPGPPLRVVWSSRTALNTGTNGRIEFRPGGNVVILKSFRPDGSGGDVVWESNTRGGSGRPQTNNTQFTFRPIAPKGNQSVPGAMLGQYEASGGGSYSGCIYWNTLSGGRKC